MRQKRTAFLLALALCLMLGGCGGFPEPLGFLTWPGAVPQTENDTGLLLGPGVEDEGLPGAEWGVFEMMRHTSVQEPQDEGFLLVYVPQRTPLYDAPYGEEIPGRAVAGASFLQVDAGDGPLWFAYKEGWLYGEDICPAPGGVPEERSLTAVQVEERFLRLEEKFPEGAYWNHMEKELPDGVESPFSVTETPCQHSRYDQLFCNQYNGSMLAVFDQFDHLCQCLGFACLLSDQLFGEDAPLYRLPEDAPLHPGDHLRLREYEHSVIVREMDEEGLRLAEVNAGYEDCLISWEREFTWQEWDDLYGWDVEYIISRYLPSPAAEAP